MRHKEFNHINVLRGLRENNNECKTMAKEYGLQKLYEHCVHELKERGEYYK
jgi:hypothetical protein